MKDMMQTGRKCLQKTSDKGLLSKIYKVCTVSDPANVSYYYYLIIAFSFHFSTLLFPSVFSFNFLLIAVGLLQLSISLSQSLIAGWLISLRVYWTHLLDTPWRHRRNVFDGLWVMQQSPEAHLLLGRLEVEPGSMGSPQACFSPLLLSEEREGGWWQVNASPREHPCLVAMENWLNHLEIYNMFLLWKSVPIFHILKNWLYKV